MAWYFGWSIWRQLARSGLWSHLTCEILAVEATLRNVCKKKF